MSNQAARRTTYKVQVRRDGGMWTSERSSQARNAEALMLDAMVERAASLLSNFDVRVVVPGSSGDWGSPRAVIGVLQGRRAGGVIAEHGNCAATEAQR